MKNINKINGIFGILRSIGVSQKAMEVQEEIT